MKFQRHVGPMWNEDAEEREPRCRQIEEQVEMRRFAKRLSDCELPEGFRLTTPQPRQFWLGQQLVWGFGLAWAPVVHGQRGADVYHHVARYHQNIGDEPQMRWALEEFEKDLRAAGVRLGEMKEYLPGPQLSRHLNIRTQGNGLHGLRYAS